jgi:hypothetical protein
MRDPWQGHLALVFLAALALMKSMCHPTLISANKGDIMMGGG